MSIKNISIKNCKSIKELKIDMEGLNCIIGRNGAGKTNIIKTISFYFQSLSSDSIEFNLNDKRNPFVEKSEIEVTFDFSYLIRVGHRYQERLFNNTMDYNEFYHNISQLDKYAENGLLKLKLVIWKNGKKEWFPNLPYKLKSCLKNLYPLYFISTRDLQLTDWSKLWDMIGELGKLQDIDINDRLEEFFSEIYGESYSEILFKVKDELSKGNININKYNINQKFLSILQLQLGGSQFKYNYTDLNYFSDGMNSYNYLNIFGILVDKISEDKLKNPLVIYDEPEIGLHPKFIDKLLQKQIHKKKKPQIIITTHSPRVLKNILKSSTNYNLYHLSEKNYYTSVKKIKSNYDHREKNIMNDLEASLYFSNKIVFVEGNTELELFSNSKLIELFSFLNDVDFYSFNADSVYIGTAHPSLRNYEVPYLILTDSDQIYEFSDGKFSLIKGKKDFLNPLDSIKFDKQHNKEKYFYGKKRNLYNLRKRIKGLEMNTYSYHKYFRTVYGSYFLEFKSLVKTYCVGYNVYPVETTIEGTLVNSNNIDIMKGWLKNKNPYKNGYIENLYSISSNNNNTTTLIRLAVNGKFDTLEKTFNQKKRKNFPDEIKRVYNTVDYFRSRYDKTSGWVTEWINYVFENYIDPIENYVEKVKEFRKYFPELYDIIYTIKNIK